MGSTCTDKKKKTPAGKDSCQVPFLSIWASVDLLFGSPDSLARIPARGKGREGENTGKGRESQMREPRKEPRGLSVL